MFSLGVDVSHWQGQMNWSKAKHAGAKFAFIRAGSVNNATGNPYKDYRLHPNGMTAGAYMPNGFYWYFRPNHNPVAQADYFANAILPYDRELPEVADVESSGGLSRGAYATSLAKFLSRLESNTGRKPIIYTRASHWNVAVGNPAWASSYALWVARYKPALQHPWGDGKFKPSSWSEWEYWQFSADGNGLGSKYGADSHSIDLNYKRVPLSQPGDLGARVDALENKCTSIEEWIRGYTGNP